MFNISERTVIVMRSKKYNRIIKIAIALMLVAAFSFTLTGVVESAVSGSPKVVPVMLSILKNIGSISAGLILPVQPSVKEEGASENNSVMENSSTSDNTTETQHTVVTDAPEVDFVPSSALETSGSDELIDNETFQPYISRLTTDNISNKMDDTAVYDGKDGEIEKYTYPKIKGDNAIDLEYGQVNNWTELTREEVISICSEKPDIKVEISPTNEPQVLIMHTHTTESYEPTDDGYYDADYEGRSLSAVNSVVGVGAVIASELAEKGITVIHDGTIFDDPLYSNSYSRSYERVKGLLEEYPSIKVVLDIHRDGIEYDGIRVAPVTEINGKEAAQMMIICGADDGTGILPQYEENLKFAAYLQSNIEEKYPTLTRPVLFDYRYYNQDLTTGSLLIEVGTLGNSMEQAKYTASLIGEEIALSLLELS